MAHRPKSASRRITLLAALALINGASAVPLNACSTQNFGSANTPFTDTWMTADVCAKDCANYQFGIVQGKNCWCSNFFTSSTTSLSNCNTGCPGWLGQSCAGNGYFGYIAINAQGSAAVSNAVGAGSVPATSVQQISVQPSSSTPPPVATSVQIATSVAIISSVNVVVSTSYAVMTRTQVMTQIIQPPSSSAAISIPPPQTVQITQVVTSAVPSPVIIPVPSSSPHTSSPSSSSSSPSSTPSPPPPSSTYVPTPVTTVEIVTVSGAVVTQIVTPTPTAPASKAPTAGEVNTLPQPEKHGLSNGAVAGITIGAVAGAAILGALLWFLCFPRRRDNDEENGSMRRQPSVLSKVGLLRGDSTHIAPARRRQQPPSLQTSGIGTFSGPASATTGNSRDMTERGSRPPFVDSRLNPHAIMTHANASRSSVGTLQDNQDYSRPLEVRNPDA